VLFLSGGGGAGGSPDTTVAWEIVAQVARWMEDNGKPRLLDLASVYSACRDADWLVGDAQARFKATFGACSLYGDKAPSQAVLLKAGLSDQRFKQMFSECEAQLRSS